MMKQNIKLPSKQKKNKKLHDPENLILVPVISSYQINYLMLE